MAEHRSRDNWSHTSALLSLIANTHRDPKKRGPYRPDEFNPFSGKDESCPTDTTEAFKLMKEVFVDKPNTSGPRSPRSPRAGS